MNTCFTWDSPQCIPVVNRQDGTDCSFNYQCNSMCCLSSQCVDKGSTYCDNNLPVYYIPVVLTAALLIFGIFLLVARIVKKCRGKDEVDIRKFRPEYLRGADDEDEASKESRQYSYVSQNTFRKIMLAYENRERYDESEDE